MIDKKEATLRINRNKEQEINKAYNHLCDKISQRIASANSWPIVIKIDNEYDFDEKYNNDVFVKIKENLEKLDYKVKIYHKFLVGYFLELS